MRRIVLAAFALTVLAACQPATMELTEEQKAAIANEVREVNADLMGTLDPVDFERLMSYWAPYAESYYVGEPAMFVNRLSVLKTTNEFREVWEPIMAARTSQQFTTINDHVAVLAEDVALYVAEGTYVITDTVGTSTEARPITTSTVYVRRDGEWKVLHIHQSWNPTN